MTTNNNILTDKQRERAIFKVTIVGGIVNAMLLAFKFVAGILGHSAAMVADAVHSLSDFFTDVIVVVFVHIANKPKDKGHDYGHGKFETMATLMIGFVLLLVGVGIAWSSAENIWGVLHGETLARPGMLALIAAAVSIIFKEALYWYTVVRGKKLRSDAVMANAWHHRSDAFSSVATIIGIGGAILLGEKWTFLDPLAALLVSFFIVKVSCQLMKPCIDELMERSLPDEVEAEIIAIVGAAPGVGELHNLHTRKIGNNYAIEFHIRMNGHTTLDEAHRVVTEIEIQLREKYGRATHVSIHMEPYK